MSILEKFFGGKNNNENSNINILKGFLKWNQRGTLEGNIKDDLIFYNVEEVLSLLKNIKNEKEFDVLKIEVLKQLKESVGFFYENSGGLDADIRVSIKINIENSGNVYGDASKIGREEIDTYNKYLSSLKDIESI